MQKLTGVFEVRNPREAAVIRALDRAVKEGTHDRLHALHSHHGRVSAWCGTGVAQGYRVQIDPEITLCSCKAGQCDQLCKHVAAVADKAGAMDLLIPDFYGRYAAALAPVVETAVCERCGGDGFVRTYFGDRRNDWFANDCRDCDKTGIVTVSASTVAA